jgi:flagellar basal body rod protein FlgF
METKFTPIPSDDRIAQLKMIPPSECIPTNRRQAYPEMISKETIRIEIDKDGAKSIIERNNVDVVTSFEDLMNLLFISGTDIKDLEAALLELSQEIQKNHKNDQQTNKNTRTLGL